MARNRMIKPEFWEDEKVGQLSPMARLMFIGALNFADDEGFIRWNEDYISASVFPYDKLSNNKTKRLMKELENLQILEVFETKFHFFVAKILNFKKHQKISKPQPSKFLQEYESHILKNQSKVENISGNGSGSNSWNEFRPKEVKGSKEKRKEVKERERECKGEEGTENDKTDFNFGERIGTENDRTAKGTATGITMPKETKSQGMAEGKNAFVNLSEIPPVKSVGTLSLPESSPALAIPEIISSTCAETFKARVEYAKSLGIEEGVAVRICNLAQSEKFPLCEMHYKGFVGKSGKEVEEAFNLLNLIAKRVKDLRSQSSKCQGHNGLRRIDSS